MSNKHIVIVLKNKIQKISLPGLIIFLFLVSLFIVAPYAGVNIATSLSDVINRFGLNAILVLALIPMVRAGCGLNFGLPIGILAGILGCTIIMQLGFTGFFGFFLAIILSIFISLIFGYLFGLVINKVKGDEMTIGLYVGLASVQIMTIMWIVLPFTKADMVMPYSGKSLRRSISLDGYWDKILNNFLSIRIGENFIFPTGLILFFSLIAFIIWFFMKTKTGTALIATGSNQNYARASGISVNKVRMIGTIFSTIVAAIGILVYQQTFGFVQAYDTPLFMAFPAIAALLIGGASVHKASILNVVVGTFLFQGVLTMTPSVINSLIQNDMSEIIRIILTNGMIIYALTRKAKVEK